MWSIIRPDSIQVLSDPALAKSLRRYLEVMDDRRRAKFILSKKLRADFDPSAPESELWTLHDRLTVEYYSLEEKIDRGELVFENLSNPSTSYLDLKDELSKRLLSSCRLCERMEGVDRTKGEVGFCKCGPDMRVSTFFEHMGEEPELVPSGTIFTVGCTMRCLHCQNWSISQMYESGKRYSHQEMAKIIEGLRDSGCRNVNLVGGDPTPWLRDWIQTLKLVECNVPVVWNSNAYYSNLTAEMLAGLVDLYLLDFKYGPGRCAERISDAPNYWQACTRNHVIAARFGELIVRVLVLPGHVECCTKPILEWISANLGKETRVNVMFQYRPEWRASEIPELSRRLTREEREQVLRLVELSGLTNYIT
ncbi:MAG: radical SAM protein [Candidatus Bathyarchaeia archaeon]